LVPRSALIRTLDQILAQVRRLVEVDGAAFLVVDPERRQVRPAATWWSTPEVKMAMEPILSRPYDRERPGLTEAAVESDRPLLVRELPGWEAVRAVADRVERDHGPEQVERLRRWHESASAIACPVRASDGRTLGVLVVSASGSQPPLGEDALRLTEVLADLAGLALERDELLAAEERRSSEELMLRDASRAVGRSLDLETVYAAILEQACTLTGGTKALLTRYRSASDDLEPVATEGMEERVTSGRYRLGEGMIGRVAKTREPYLSRRADEPGRLDWVLEAEGIGSFVHIPLELGPRLFGVLSVSHPAHDHFGARELGLLREFSVAATAAVANAMDYVREQRVARALTRSFVPGELTSLPGLEVGLLYEPAEGEPAGGDFFGAWPTPSGGVAMLVGDVTGHGVEVAALSAMVRFFVEARAWDDRSPSEVLREANTMLRPRLPGDALVTAFFAAIGPAGIRYASAGHPAPLMLRASGELIELGERGVPLGTEREPVSADASESFEQGDLLFAYTDGLIEARREGEQLGPERLRELVAEHRSLPPRRLVRAVHDRVASWSGGLKDDVVVFAVRRGGAPSA
jgi:GAF domain-containing protein